MHRNFQFINTESVDEYQHMIEHEFLWPCWEPSADVVDNGTIVPAESFYDEAGILKYRGGVLDSEGRFVRSSALYKSRTPGYAEGPFSMTECPVVELKECAYIDEEVVYYGLFFHHWGHFLFESTNRLWYYLSEKCLHRRIRLFGIYLNEKPDGNFKSFHEMLGISQDTLVFLDRPTRFRRVIVPNPSSMLASYSKEFLIPFDAIRNSVPTGSSRKIYLTRTQFKKGDTIGEKDIEENFRKNGFDVIAPENETLQTLVSLLKGAEVVAGLSGSNTHNLLFANPGCKTIILNRLQGTNQPQEMVHQARNMQAIYIDVYSTFLPVTHGYGPFLVSVNDNLFNYQITAGMLPYNLAPRIPSDTILRFLETWAEVHHDKPFAATALVNAYQCEAKDFIEQIISFFTKNKMSSDCKITRKKLDSLLLLHKHRIKKIYEMVDTDKSKMCDLDVIKYSYYFNSRWYRKKYLKGIKDTEPAAHYLHKGFISGNDPSPRFSTNGYLALYPDINEAGLNPLWHYEKHGKLEGRQIVKVKMVNH